jgi:thiosulfate reductase cytochrome b subunit
LAASIVFLVRWFLTLHSAEVFLDRFPGEYDPPDRTESGFPAWARWGHFFNFFLLTLIVRSGLQVRWERKPPAYWASKRNPAKKISINLWFHQILDVLWLVNGAVFVLMLLVSGRWVRIVPTSWEVFPNALSAVLQYVSLNWPTDNGWVNYNALQQLTYFVTVFVAAPLAAISGVRMSAFWPKRAKALNKVYPIELARAIHFPVMLYFVIFVVFHVALVLATGALRNLNHIYAGQDVINWAGFWIFAGSILLTVATWIAVRPPVIASLAKWFGHVSAR